MNNYKAVKLYRNDKFDFYQKNITEYSEMTAFDRSFLCGLILEKKPKRILEIGVAAGATTVVMLDLIERMQLQTELISVDYCKQYYRDEEKATGFVATNWKNEKCCKVNHIMYTGGVVAEYIDAICDEEKIDFLVIDTVHTLPGEVMDFLVCFPYLNEKAIVVLHDVSLLFDTGCEESYATRLLFNSVKADKYYMLDEGKFTNIAAFQITEDTENSLLDVLFTMAVSWEYLPDKHSLDLYHHIISKNYDDYFIQMYEALLRQQMITSTNLQMRLQYQGDYQNLEKMWREKELVYIYGAGVLGRFCCQFAENKGLQYKSIVVSDDQKIDNTIGKDYGALVCHLSDIPKSKDAWFVLAVNEKNYDICKKNLNRMGFLNIL